MKDTMCKKCNKPYCVCLGNLGTNNIVDNYICKLSTIMFTEGIHMTQQDFKNLQQLQQDMVSWSNGDPMPYIHDVIRKTTIIIWKYTHLFQTDE